MTDLYRVLQVDPSADAEVVEAAYRRLARKFHPDVSRSPDAEARIRDLNAAYEILGDPLRRAAYDRSRAAPAPPPRTHIRVVAPRPRSAPPRPPHPRLNRPILALATAGLATSVAIAAISAQLFSAATAPPDAASAAAIVVVSSPREEPIAYDPPPRRPTPTAAGWPPPILVVEAADTKTPAVDLLSRFVGAARQATRRLQGPTPPERPYNPTAP